MSVHDTPAQVSLLDGASAKYCVDANFFYEFWLPDRKFRKDIYDKLWKHMVSQISGGVIASTEEVYRECRHRRARGDACGRPGRRRRRPGLRPRHEHQVPEVQPVLVGELTEALEVEGPQELDLPRTHRHGAEVDRVGGADLVVRHAGQEVHEPGRLAPRVAPALAGPTRTVSVKARPSRS